MNQTMKNVLLLLLLVPLAGILAVGGCAGGWFVRAADVAAEQVDPRRLLQEYERFKDQHASLSAKREGLGVLAARIDGLESAYEGESRSAWSRDDRQLHGQMTAELAGLKLSYNNLAATYNANMAKANYRFCNVGSLPQGASEPLPREYAPYESN